MKHVTCTYNPTPTPPPPPQPTYTLELSEVAAMLLVDVLIELDLERQASLADYGEEGFRASMPQIEEILLEIQNCFKGIPSVNSRLGGALLRSLRSKV